MEDQPHLLETIGRLPHFCQESTVFVANLLAIFFENEEKMQMLLDAVGGAESYGGRMLPVVNLIYQGKENNLLILEKEPAQCMFDYFRNEAGLSLPDTCVVSHSEYLHIGSALRQGQDLDADLIERITSNGNRRMDGYVTDQTLYAMAKLCQMRPYSTINGSRAGNNKLLLHRFIERSDFPTLPTEIAANPGAIKAGLERLQQGGYESAVIKAPIGASGVGMIMVDRIADQGRLDGVIPDHFFSEGPCLVQGWVMEGKMGVRKLYSPSVQLFLSDSQVALYDLTEQYLSHCSVHEGNESPPLALLEQAEYRAEILRQAAVAGHWLHDQGYRGMGSVDFILCEKGRGAFSVYICEINARVTGATYPSVLAHHFISNASWFLKNIHFASPQPGEAILNKLRTSSLLFRPQEMKHGIVPVNLTTNGQHLADKGQFLFLTEADMPREVLFQMVTDVEKILCSPH